VGTSSLKYEADGIRLQVTIPGYISNRKEVNSDYVVASLNVYNTAATSASSQCSFFCFADAQTAQDLRIERAERDTDHDSGGPGIHRHQRAGQGRPDRLVVPTAGVPFDRVPRRRVQHRLRAARFRHQLLRLLRLLASIPPPSVGRLSATLAPSGARPVAERARLDRYDDCHAPAAAAELRRGERRRSHRAVAAGGPRRSLGQEEQPDAVVRRRGWPARGTDGVR
jgi:hypothetical protein